MKIFHIFSSKAALVLFLIVVFCINVFSAIFTQSVLDSTINPDYYLGNYSGKNINNNFLTINGSIDWNKSPLNDYNHAKYAWYKYNNAVSVPTNTISTNGGVSTGAVPNVGDTDYVMCPDVIKDGNGYKMYYVGYSVTGAFKSSQRLYVATSLDGLVWSKYDTNVVNYYGQTEPRNDFNAGTQNPPGKLLMGVGSSASGDYSGTGCPAVIKEESGTYPYKMWYTASGTRIYHAYSTDGINWIKYKNDRNLSTQNSNQDSNGQILLGTAGTTSPAVIGKGDSSVAINPTVIKDGNTYKMWYIGAETPQTGKYKVYYATSQDGVTWRKYNNDYNSSTQNTGQTSINGQLLLGGSGTGDSYHIGAYEGRLKVILDGNLYRMWYSANNGSGQSSKVFYAYSTNGLNWIKYDNTVNTSRQDTGQTSTNGGLLLGSSGSGDFYNAYSPTVIFDNNIYKMWYTGQSTSAFPYSRRIYYATSPDGISWTKYDNSIPVDSDKDSTNGRIPNGSKVRGDQYYARYPAVIKDNNSYKMYYSGYDAWI